MSFTSPKTFAPGEVLSAEDMNTYVSANTADLNARLAELEATRPNVAYGVKGSDSTITGTSYVSIGLSASITVNEGSKVLVQLSIPYRAEDTSSDDLGLAIKLLRGSDEVAVSNIYLEADPGGPLSAIDEFTTFTRVLVDDPGEAGTFSYSVQIVPENGTNFVTAYAGSTMVLTEVYV